MFGGNLEISFELGYNAPMHTPVYRAIRLVAVSSMVSTVIGCVATMDSSGADGGPNQAGAMDAGGADSGQTPAAPTDSSNNQNPAQGGQNNVDPAPTTSSTSQPPPNPPGPTTSSTVYGAKQTGEYHLGPVDFAQTQWPNACAPAGGYRAALRDGSGLGGEYLAGVGHQHVSGGAVCDSCISIETAKGKSVIARVVTYGDTNQPNDIDVSPSVYSVLNTGEYPRSMSWQFAKCPDTGTLRYEFQTEANVWWTSFWVRNQRVPITKVEVKSANHPDFFELRRETDGTLNDDGGFGEGAFTLRLTGMDGQVITDTLPGFSPGELIVSTQQFP